MTNRKFSFLPVVALLSACASTPMGPTVPVMPAQGKPFEQFTRETDFCKYQASNAVRGQAENANHRAVLGALLPTALGAGMGAAVGSAYGNRWHGSYAGTGAGIGAASGAVVGTAMGVASSSRAQGGIQMQYDNAYAACMVSYGNMVPIMAPPQMAQPQMPQPQGYPPYNPPPYSY